MLHPLRFPLIWFVNSWSFACYIYYQSIPTYTQHIGFVSWIALIHSVKIILVRNLIKYSCVYLSLCTLKHNLINFKMPHWFRSFFCLKFSSSRTFGIYASNMSKMEQIVVYIVPFELKIWRKTVEIKNKYFFKYFFRFDEMYWE